MADMLQEQFGSVFSDTHSMRIKQPPDKTLTDKTLDNTDFSEDVLKAINEIKVNSAGYGFPAIVLKSCKENLAYPLVLLWKNSMDTGYNHQMFLHQLITPIYKGKGSKCKAANYRPISLTSHIIKVFERIVRDKLVRYLEENQMISPNQHGFR